MFKDARHLFLSRGTWIKSTPSHPVSLRSILILPSHLLSVFQVISYAQFLSFHTLLWSLCYTRLWFSGKETIVLELKTFCSSRFLLATTQSSFSVFCGMTSRTVKNTEFLTGEFTYVEEWSYLLTPWCRVLLEKLTCLQLVKIFPAFHGTRRFITALTRVRHLSLSWASPIQSTYTHPTSWRSILLLSTHLRLGFPSGLFPSGFPTKILCTPLSSPIRTPILLRISISNFWSIFPSLFMNGHHSLL